MVPSSLQSSHFHPHPSSLPRIKYGAGSEGEGVMRRSPRAGVTKLRPVVILPPLSCGPGDVLDAFGESWIANCAHFGRSCTIGRANLGTSDVPEVCCHD